MKRTDVAVACAFVPCRSSLLTSTAGEVLHQIVHSSFKNPVAIKACHRPRNRPVEYTLTTPTITTTNMSTAGGIKGFLQKTGKAGIWAMETGTSLFKWTYKFGGQAAFVLATTSMVVLMPLLFEITREGQVCNDYSLKIYVCACSSILILTYCRGLLGCNSFWKRNVWRPTIFGKRVMPTVNWRNWDLVTWFCIHHQFPPWQLQSNILICWYFVTSVQLFVVASGREKHYSPHPPRTLPIISG